MLPSDRNELIQPFYLHMMRLNALEHGDDLLPLLAEAAEVLSADDVISLLRDPWRSTVMGAWFALRSDESAVTDEVLHALERSAGSLTSPPLAVAAVVLVGEEALPSLAKYATADATNGWGACGFIAAAANHLGGEVGCSASEADKHDFKSLLEFAGRLRRGA